MDSSKKAGLQFSRTLLFAFAAMAVNYGISLVLTPYITEILGAEAYGFVSLAKTVSNYGIIITSCLNSYAARFIALAYHGKDYKRANTYYSTVILANVALLVAVMLGTVFFIYYIESFFVVPKELLFDVRLLFGLDILNFMLLALANMFSVYASVKDRLHAMHLTRMVSYLAEACVLVLMYLVFRPKIYYVGIALLVSTAVLGVINYIKAKKELPELKVSMRNFSRPAVKDLVGSGIWNSINSVGNLLNSGLDLWVSNLMLSATAMGQLSIVKTVYAIFASVAQLISTLFHPHLLRCYSRDDRQGVVAIFKNQLRFSGYVGCVMCAGFISLGSVYYSLWTPNQDIGLINGISIVTVVGFFFEAIATPLFYTYTLTLKNKVPCFLTIISGLLNVLGMYLLLNHTDLGLYAVVGTTTVLGLTMFFVFTPLYAAHCLQQKWYVYYGTIARNVLSFAVIMLVFAGIAKLWMPASWLGLILCAGCMAIIAVPIHVLIVCPLKDTKNICKKVLRRVCNGR